MIADRFTDSTLVYQGAGRGLGTDLLLMLNRATCRSLTPDLTLLLDMDFDISLGRAQQRNMTTRSAETRLDDESAQFHQRVYEGYRALAQGDPNRVRIVDATNDPAAVHEDIWHVLTQALMLTSGAHPLDANAAQLAPNP